MTNERNFDRLARAWLEVGPAEAPDRLIAAVLQAAETTPQMRRPIRRPPWRFLTMTPMRTGAAIAAVLVVAVGGAYLIARNNTVGPGATATPNATLAATPSGTSAPTLGGTLVPDATVVVTQRLVYAWPDPASPSSVSFQVIAEVQNQGTTWAELVLRQGATWAIRDGTGTVTIRESRFFDSDAYPAVIGPGEVSYLFQATSWPDTSAKDMATVDIALPPSSIRSVEQAPTNDGSFGAIAWQVAASGTGLVASGRVTTSGTGTLPYAHVVVFCIGSSGSILGATSVTLQNLVEGQPTEFLTAGTTPPLTVADCMSARAFVGPGQSPE
jgi:hypothetical protein